MAIDNYRDGPTTYSEYAVDLAELGPIFPAHSPQADGTCSCGDSKCDNVGKHPRYHQDDLPSGRNSATTDLKQITVWWKRWPNANIAIVTGHESNIIVLDLDSEEAFNEALRRGIPRTWIVKTARGWQVYFKRPAWEKVPTIAKDDPKNGRLLWKHAEMELKADGGYVIAPPSRHGSGITYAWEVSPDAAPLADPPDWVLEILRAKIEARTVKASQAQTHSTQSSAAGSDIDPEATALINKKVGQVVGAQNGSRNDTLYDASNTLGGLIGAGRADRTEVESRLLRAAVAVGLTEQEAAKTIKSGVERGMKDPLHKRQRLADLIEFPAERVNGKPTAPTDQLAEWSDPWRPFTLADAYAPRPPREYVVAGLFPLPSLSIVYGAPGCLKTTLLMDLTASVLKGNLWLPPFPGFDAPSRATKQASVMWVDFDMGQDDTHERFEAIGRGHNLPPDAPLVYYSMPSPWLDASSVVHMDQLIKRVLHHGAKLVILDNLGAIRGGVEENSADMGTLMAQFRRLAEETRAAVVIIHHQRKSAAGSNGRAGDTLRGHSSIEAALNLALLIEREEGSTIVTGRATKVRGADVLPFAAQFSYDHKPGTTELESVRFYGIAGEDTKSDSALDRTIFEALQAHSPRNQSQLVADVKKTLSDMGEKRIRARINVLAEKGRIRTATGEKNAKEYSLVELGSLVEFGSSLAT